MYYHQEKVQYLRIILTNQCNLNCFYCHKEGTKKVNEELSCSEIVEYTKILYDIGIRKIKLMGGEPTLRNDIVDIIREIRKYAVEADISLITNGILIKEVAEKYIEAGLNRINVSIHGWNPQNYSKVTGSSEENLERIKNSILWLKENKMLTKINFVIQKGANEEEVIELIHWCIEHDLTLDLLNMLYYSKTKDKLKSFYYDFSEIKKFISEHFDISSIERFDNNYSLPSTRIFLENGGRVNLKTNMLNNEFAFNNCKGCKEFEFCLEGIKAIRLTNKGIIKPCLFRDDNTFNLKAMYEECSYDETVNKTYDYILNI